MAQSYNNSVSPVCSLRILQQHMSVFISSLNSGSNGNCYYIGSENDAVLVDAGISCRETEKRMKRLGLSMERVRAVFISHEHSDHISGLATLSKKFQLPVYITKDTQAYGKAWVEKHLIRRFEANTPVRIGELLITAFPKFHDAGDPHSFMICSESVKVGVFTDIGSTCKNVITHFRQCNAVFLESNYDEDMLMNGSYPLHLKKRISNGKGHLSNSQALELFRKHRPPFMSHLILSHLSRNNNHPDIVHRLFNPYAGHTEICVASRDMESPVFHITPVKNPVEAFTPPLFFADSRQLSLFDM